MESRLTVLGRGQWVEGSSKKGKGLMDMDNTAVIAERRGYRRNKW